MWALALLALTALLFVIGAAIGLVWFLAGRNRGVRRALVAAAMPFGCAAIPIVGLLAATLVAAAFQENDLQLYQEVFGTGTTVPVESILFDHFGRGPSREIYMRIYPDGSERAFLESLPGLEPSDMTTGAFIRRGEEHGFMWWLSADPGALDRCPSPRIMEADGFNGWRQLRLADCASEQESSMAGSEGPIYVIAWRRLE